MNIHLPDGRGHWGHFGGRYVPETVMRALYELNEEYCTVREDVGFQRELDFYLNEYAGRPTSLYLASRLMEKFDGVKIYLKREDLAHTGAHKINNTIGQVLLAARMGKRRVIAETGAGQHGVATATACALMGIDCDVYMGSEDMKRQKMNVFRMELLGTNVIPVESGSRTLKDAINEAMRDWVTHIDNTYYCIGSVVGPHPYPMMVRDFQKVIGQEVKEQISSKEGRLPDLLVACVGGGSNAIGLFYPFLDEEVQLVGVEAGGLGLHTNQHGASLSAGEVGSLHGAMSYLLQNQDGQVMETHSVSAGLDYPGVGPEHAYLKETGRVQYTTVTDQEALEAFDHLSKKEGIIPALESAHAVAYTLRAAAKLSRDQIVIVNLSGRGDKDLEIVEGLV